jgi:methylmalonyl-CoA mutase C-terminal domain/subunit
MNKRKVKILMVKAGLEGHWAGLVVVSSALRDAGFEVIYGGNMTPVEVAAAAVQEDVDVVGMSSLTANYMLTVPAVIKGLKERGKGDVLLILGGIIYEDDFDTLREMGVAGIFIPGTPLEEIVDFVREKTSALVK